MSEVIVIKGGGGDNNGGDPSGGRRSSSLDSAMSVGRTILILLLILLLILVLKYVWDEIQKFMNGGKLGQGDGSGAGFGGGSGGDTVGIFGTNSYAIGGDSAAASASGKSFWDRLKETVTGGNNGAGSGALDGAAPAAWSEPGNGTGEAPPPSNESGVTEKTTWAPGANTGVTTAIYSDSLRIPKDTEIYAETPAYWYKRTAANDGWEPQPMKYAAGFIGLYIASWKSSNGYHCVELSDGYNAGRVCVVVQIKKKYYYLAVDGSKVYINP